MKKFNPSALILFSLLPISSSAREARHMVTFGGYGLGGSLSTERIETRSQSPFSSIKKTVGRIGLNYAYRFNARWQVGGFYYSSHEEYKFRPRGQNEEISELETDNIGLFALYNFHDEINRAWYAGVKLARHVSEEENSHAFKDAEGKAPFEIDDAGETYSIIIGKRFSFLSRGIKHLSYSPEIGIFHKTHGKDFNDQHSKDGKGAEIHLLKFDFLF